MSYVIHIWQTPIPTSVLQADKICDRLQDKEGRQNPKFIELAKRLTQRYPCRSQMTGDEDDEEGAWLDEPLDGISPNPVLALGISSDYIVEAMPFVVETANALGLMVYDTQAGECYLPDGKVLTMPGQAPVELEEDVDPERIYSSDQIIKIAATHSADYFKKYGYKYSRKGNCFVKKHDGFYHSVTLWGGGVALAVSHAICITKALHLVSHLGNLNYVKPEQACVIELRNFDNGYVKTWPDVYTPYRAERGDISVNSMTEVRSAMDKIMVYEEQTFMPLWSQIKTLEDVQQFMTAPAYEALWNTITGNEKAQLLLAYLTKAENLDELYFKLRAAIVKSEIGYAPDVISHVPGFDKIYELMKLEQKTGT